MQQAILPQLNAPANQPDPAARRSVSEPRSAGGRSYDDVSREEASRADPAESKATEPRQSPEDATGSETAGRPEKKTPDEPAEGSEAVQASGEKADKADPLPMTGAALTFANLQSLLTPVTDAPPGDSGQGVGPLISDSGLLANGKGGLGGGQMRQDLLMGLMSPGDGADGKSFPPGTRLSELLSANVTTETGRPVDLVSANGAPRFQTTLELAAQQTPQAARLTAETAVPLRGYATSVDVPLGQAEWGDKVMGKLSWLTARNMSVAEIHLTPPDMGPMEVKVRVQNDQANITVHAANPVVREQLELHSHRLRDMLGEQGLGLGQFDVSDQPGRQASEQSAEEGNGSGTANGRSDGLAESGEAPLGTGQLDLGWRGEVDVFA